MMMMERDRSGTWRARRSPRTETSGSVRQRMALEDVQMKTVALKCSAGLRITGDPVRQVLRGGLGRPQRNLRKGEQVALLSGEQKNQLIREQVNLHRGEQVALLGGE
ncbi:uncharacterized protein PITG_17566 [Phytophthora infestans T30-4]|uniref:Uncharacterized protein n=1 Tax=Phytophthora infestans (strain T30-4) TaxID=403677 RepID=D0NWN9_PHYIT|nr:uncharacterized protein PITG_17566 [Phytophthora infestans T30-4]EEY67472.1 conserved hypothetical protein [Phytophthora infestans T30-4]|eukprot:XP_002896445.1 conserved hypothetical protein [Phytophthora infestans T30-4]